ncbi:Ubiquitin fusion degradation protein 1 [Phytophthora nicotianae]|uniref:Ubiquitin fusion degradation protein 1 n=1 Tax=Phytophthora nicotianae TaxID=4792 RepID=A0A0W8CKC1_PHYNI|nr:Ubiquitin fusion degradation protein 1 [Phytophthora nicotianae]
MPHLEFGDKIVLPPEFSSPDGQVFVPYWLMQNLGVREGGSVVVTSVVNLPRGVYCRLQPETTSFLDLAAEIGPKLLMETALRRYSVLSTGSTIVIEYGSVRYNVRVVELKPAAVVSLCGDVDLETDFMPPEFECSTCQEKILRIHESRHHHCPDCSVLCDNNETLADHQRNEHTASSKCSLCHAFFTRAELQNHLDNRQCAHALMPECKSYVKITDLDTHEQQCAAFARQESTLLKPETSVATTTSSQNAIECVYCLQGNFPDIAAVEYHVLRDCHVAKSFTTEPTRTNQEEADPVSSEDVEEPHSSEIVRPLLAQGRMRRKDDANALRCTASRSLFSSNNNHWNQRNPPPSPTVLPPVRLALQAGKLRKLKPKPRPNPHVRSLSQPAKLAAKSVHTSDRNVNFGSPDLCISSVGGNSQRSQAIPPCPQATTRTRRRPAANLPRLEKLP